MLWENKIKCFSEIPLGSIPCPILHIQLEIKPIKTLVGNITSIQSNQTAGYNPMHMEFSGGMELVGGGSGVRTSFWWVELKHLPVWTSPPGAGHCRREVIDAGMVLWDLSTFARALKTVHMKIIDFSLTFPQLWMPLSSLPAEITAVRDAVKPRPWWGIWKL